jgi:hypothetical protein
VLSGSRWRRGQGLAARQPPAGLGQLRSSQLPRAARTARDRASVGLSVPARTRHAVASETAGANKPAADANRQIRDRLTPSASNTARSTASRPGSCAERRTRSYSNV